MIGAQSAGAPPWRLPSPVAGLVARLPQVVPSAALAAALNVAIARMRDREALAALRGRVVRVVVRDAGLTLTLRCTGSRVHPGSTTAAADVTISACAADFLLLAARKEDADTLFFARRLAIEGDTDTGLVVKNLLDAADLSRLTQLVDRASTLLRGLRA
ncbi:MAG: SCP2 sterol-binding domain-containing protein [Burkholderiales bacterium]|nr:SCP2 sterol-binding domain-containing protein [Burkholderiales bacterium]